MDRLFDSVIVRTPSNSYTQCISTNPDKGNIDIQLARKQHHTYVSILKENGIKVVELPPCETYPDSVFMQDPAVLGIGRSIIGRFGEVSRRGEQLELISELKELSLLKDSDMLEIQSPGTVEGGDIMITDRKELFVGQSPRTNSEGIEQLRRIFHDLKVVGVKTEQMHLLCGCSYLSESTMIITPDLVNPLNFPGMRYVKLGREDWYASDAMYLGNHRVLIPSGYPNASEKLREAGYYAVEVDVSEFHKGDGGVTCLSSPIYNVL